MVWNWSKIPILETPAKVLAKAIEVIGEMARTRYYLSFELPSRERIYLAVDLATYITLLERESGTLKYKVSGSDTQFESFVRD